MPTKPAVSSISTIEKPRPDFPLTPHRGSGQWCKKFGKKYVYFGPLEKPDEALAKYLDEKDEWQAGRNPRTKLSGVTLEELCNLFLDDKAERVKNGERSHRTLRDYNRTFQALCDHVGKTTRVIGLEAEEFKKIRTRFATLQDGSASGLVTLMNHMRRLRTLFYFALEHGWLSPKIKEAQLRKLLEIPSKKSRRIERNAKGPRTLEAIEIRRILISSSLQMRAMTLLGINCALGQTDVSALPESALDLNGGWLNYPRVKTGIKRRCPLWPETVATLRDVLAKRKKPKDSAHAKLIFITQQGHPFVGVSDTGIPLDAIGLTFSRLLKRLGLHRPGVGFYTLRHMFETIGGETEAQVPVDFIMGHAPDDDDMSAEYREFIKDERLKRVTDHVRLWLWPEGSEAAWLKAEEAKPKTPAEAKPAKKTSSKAR